MAIVSSILLCINSDPMDKNLWLIDRMINCLDIRYTSPFLHFNYTVAILLKKTSSHAKHCCCSWEIAGKYKHAWQCDDMIHCFNMIACCHFVSNHLYGTKQPSCADASLQHATVHECNWHGTQMSTVVNDGNTSHTRFLFFSLLSTGISFSLSSLASSSGSSAHDNISFQHTNYM